MADEMQYMPSLQEGSSTTPDVTKLSFLSAKWINERIFNVAAQVDKYIDRIVDQGLLVDGFAPFESPITDEVLMRMTPDQFRALYDSEASIEGKAALIARVKNLKLPLRELLPDEGQIFDPYRTTPPLEREPTDTVSSSEATV